MLEPPTEAKTRETTSVAEQNVIAEIGEKHSIFLKGNKAMYVTLIGHANDNGSRSFNLAVADARVESVGAAL